MINIQVDLLVFFPCMELRFTSGIGWLGVVLSSCGLHE
jgi:hypothetical protein